MVRFYILLCLSCVLSTEANQKSNLYMRVINFMTCPEMPDLPNSFQNVTFRKDPKTEKMYITGTMQLKEPIQDGMVIHAVINKCMSEETVSCNKYLEVEESDFCNHLPEKNKIWSSIVEAMREFVPNCPVPPGNYSVDNGYLDTAAFDDMQVLNGYWQVHLVYAYQGKPLMCVVSFGELRQKRRKKSKPSQG